MSDRLDYPGVRWRVVRELEPVARRQSVATHTRRRLLMRCVCGHEQAVWEEDLVAGRSNGCKSGRCRSAWEAVRGIKRLLSRWVNQPETHPLEKIGDELAPHREHITEVMNRALDSWLKLEGERVRAEVEEETVRAR